MDKAVYSSVTTTKISPHHNLIIDILHKSYTPKMQLKGPCNINKLIHRTEEAFDVQSELIFVDSMVYLPKQ